MKTKLNNNSIKQYGLIGYPLSHSFSKSYFEDKFEREGIEGVTYSNYETLNLEDFFENIGKDLDGFNITMPYKQAIIPLLDEISPEAKEIGGVNVVKKGYGKKIYKGYNTDWIGFKKSLVENIEDISNLKALVLGSGASSQSIAYTLRELSIEHKIVSRRKQNHTIIYRDLDKELLETHKLIINTTPMGMGEDIGKYPDINTELIDSSHIVYDLIYNPEETILLRLSKQRGAKIINGRRMLETQAEEAWKIWTNNTLP